jgi:hypothetical protein
VRITALVVLGGLACVLYGQTGKPETSKVMIIHADRFDKSIALRDMKHVEITHEGEPEHGPLRPPMATLKRIPSGRLPVDAALQPAGQQPGAPLTILNFAGQGYGFPGYSDEYIPPDTNGSVGLTQYVQWVNGTFAIFDKSTGSLVSGPFAGNTLWQGFGGLCESNNAGDPIAQYDKANDRWVMAQFTGDAAAPYYECFAISETDDATGAWYRYSFQMPYFNDYPKIGIWPDAYYGTFNFFDSNLDFVQGEACAFQSSAMLFGLPASAQCFGSVNGYSYLPSDLDGNTPPPEGAPNYMLQLDFSTEDQQGQLIQLDLWQFHVDWNTPANSTFQQTAVLPVAGYIPACAFAPDPYTCISQNGTTQTLASLGDRLMYRLAYRNFGSYESLLVNHSVDVDTGFNNEGVRWYEIRDPSTAPYVYQQSTFAPDQMSRWMGSMAMDNAGNIALGYGTSSPTSYPSVVFTGRVATDPLNTMESEVTMAAGTGDQIPQNGNTAARWGDYSSFSVDPVDDCTLWYTHEYMSTTGDFIWSTRIGNISFPTCQPVARPPNLSLTVQPAAITIDQNHSGIINVITEAVHGFNAEVSLAASGLPPGASAVFSPASFPSPGSGASTLTLSPGPATPAGTYPVTITATGGGFTPTSTVPLTVLNFGSVSLNSSLNPSTSGQYVTLTAKLLPTSATGTVTFYDGVSILGVRPLVAGTASLRTDLLASGSRSLKAIYSGDFLDAGDSSAVLTQTVVPLYSSGFITQPLILAKGDFNGDSILDLAAIDSLGLEEFTGNGDGTFQAPVTTAGGQSVSTLAVADFNGDGRADLIDFDTLLGLVESLSNGDGTFQQIPLPPFSYTLAVGDFNGDGKADIGFLCEAGDLLQNAGDLGILLGNGDGTFQAPVFYPGLGLYFSDPVISVGDFNGDGNADVVMGPDDSGELAVYLGKGDGTFQPLAKYAGNRTILGIAVGDLNGDGRSDLVLTGNAGVVSVLLANADGTFQPAVVYPAEALQPFGVAVADISGDGTMDIALSDAETDNWYFLPGNGDGSFQSPIAYATGSASAYLAVGDFNRDGRPDVVVSEPFANGLDLFLANTPTYTSLTSSPNPANFSQSVTLTATLSPATAAGTATFFNGATKLGTATLVGGMATFATSSLPPGSDSLSANYSGGGIYSNSTGTLIEQIGCSGISPGSIYTDSTGAPQTLTISTASPSCQWTLSTTTPWLQLSATSGTGPGAVTVTAPPNTTAADLTGSITFGTQNIPDTEDFTAQTFTDVLPNAYYFDAVNLFYAHGITNGCNASPLEFCPTASITRAQMAIFIVRSIFGGDDFTAPTTPYFSDVAPTDFGFAWIQEMAALGITNGCAAGLYCPTASVTRQQMAVFIIRARYGSTAVFDYLPTPLFTDVPANAFAFNYIQRMKMDNITSGCTVTTYCPDNVVTRGDMAIFVMRGGYNNLLPATEPILSSISPSTIAQGASGTYTLTGVSTSFVDGTTTLAPIPGIAVGTVTVTSPTTLTVQLTATGNATQQPVSVQAITGTSPGNQEAVLPNGLVIQ